MRFTVVALITHTTRCTIGSGCESQCECSLANGAWNRPLARWQRDGQASVGCFVIPNHLWFFSCIHFLASISDCTPGSRWFPVVHSGHWATSAARVIGHLIRFGTLLIQSMSCHLIRQSWLRSQETLIEINWFPLTRFVSRIRNGLKNDRMKVPSVQLLLLLTAITGLFQIIWLGEMCMWTANWKGLFNSNCNCNCNWLFPSTFPLS